MNINHVKLEKINYILRIAIIMIIIIVLMFLCIARLMKIQIVEGASYLSMSQKNYTAYQSIQAARGQIVDNSGRVLNTNKVVYKVIIQKAFFTAGQENRIIADTLKILEHNNEKWIDTVPITQEQPFRFTETDDLKLDKFKKYLNLNVDATVENCIQALKENYNISPEYDEKTARKISGVRYEMYVRDFSHNNRYTMCEDISLETVIKLKEKSSLLSGIDIIEEPIRIYLDGKSAAHSRGTIGPVTAEEYADLKEQGYSLNDIIGKSGIEYAMESVLRGENGVRTIVRNAAGVAISDEITTGVKTGNSVKLTIDSKFQNTVQTILQNHVSWLHTIEQTEKTANYQRGQNTEGGAVVVLEVKTGKVLALANYPTYDINDYIENYGKVLNADLNPLVNRATTGLYRPGSTFKTITSVAGLFYEAINPKTVLSCTGVYKYYTDYQPKCTGVHGSVNLSYALQQSCNCYFYEVGRLLGMDRFAEVAKHFGIGTNLGLETGGSLGRTTTVENFAKVSDREMTGGDVLQAAIGQSETLLTPLNLAVQALTLANNGVRYRPYLVDSVWNYDYSEMIYKTEPQIMDSFAEDRTDIFDSVKEGMIAVTKNIAWPPNRMEYNNFDYLPSKAAVKTGSPEVGDGTFNSAVLGFYPADDPVIAFGVMVENSDFSRYIIRNIIDAYFYNAYEPDINAEGIIISPWKRWDENKVKRLTG